MTMNGSWGYKSWDDKWKSNQTLIQNLVDIASKGGNYLLNIGPKDDGTFPPESIERLRAMGAWMKINGEAIYATKASPLAPLPWGRITRKETAATTTLYVTVFDWPKDGKLVIPGLKNKVVSAKLLAGGGKIKTSYADENLVMEVPATAPDAIASVIKVELKGRVANVNTAAKSTMKTGELD
jgi:alpha-L-fucosidase